MSRLLIRYALFFILIFIVGRLFAYSVEDSARFSMYGVVIIFVFDMVLSVVWNAVLHRRRAKELKRLLKEE